MVALTKIVWQRFDQDCLAENLPVFNIRVQQNLTTKKLDFQVPS